MSYWWRERDTASAITVQSSAVEQQFYALARRWQASGQVVDLMNYLRS